MQHKYFLYIYLKFHFQMRNEFFVCGRMRSKNTTQIEKGFVFANICEEFKQYLLLIFSYVLNSFYLENDFSLLIKRYLCSAHPDD